MGSAVIEEFDVLVDDPPGMALIEDQHMIQAFAANGAEKPFAQRIGSRCLQRRVEQLNVSDSNGPLEQQPILVIIVANQKARTNPEGCRFAHLLSDPSIARDTCDGDMDNPSGAV